METSRELLMTHFLLQCLKFSYQRGYGIFNLLRVSQVVIHNGKIETSVVIR